ncbi:Lipase 1 [Phytophthora ramorum]|nr:Lipase 1 [Phytophthora ramorum]
MRPLAYTLAIGSLLAAFSSASDSPTVTVKNGSYYGVYQDTYDQDLFLGMPYAQPPVGDLRFRNPEPLNSTWSDSKNATEYSPECYGYGSDQWVLGNVISEDCLTINVVRPKGIAEGAELPVAVWIHGGGFTEGGSRDPRYNQSHIIKEATDAGMPFIGVSINYRLQAFGFLWGTAVKEAGVSNLGLKDQHLALHWVQENIAAFGGDTSKVTIWGESAGAMSVGYQLLAYDGRDDGLYSAAIMESGAPAKVPSTYLNKTEWDVYYNNITSAANCSSAADTLDCLRQVPIDTLSSIFNNDGPTLLSDGKFVHVPILHGVNNDEGSAFGAAGATVSTTEEFVSFLTDSMGETEETAAILTEVYPDIPEIGVPGTMHGRPATDSGYGVMYKRAAAYGGDAVMHAPRRYLSEIWAANDLPSYSYVFNVLTAGNDEYIGATHFTEVAFVFYNLLGDGYNNSVATDPFLNKPESYKQLARVMTRMWASFIVHGNPNENGVTALEWPEYTSDSAQNIVFDANVTELAYVAPDTYRAEGIAYLTSLYNATA